LKARQSSHCFHLVIGNGRRLRFKLKAACNHSHSVSPLKKKCPTTSV
jgi:hypothetical protein